MLVATTQGVTLKAKLFYGFSDPSRLSILEALRDQPLNVTDIVTRTGLTQSNVSNHLSCLRDCGLVTREQQGRYAIYALSDPRIAYLLALVGNVASLFILQRARREDANMKASWIFTSNDVVVNLSVIVAGLLVFVTGSPLPDLVVGAVVFGVVGYGAFRILKLSR